MRYLVLAASYRIACDWARERKVPKGNWQHVSRPEQALGVSPKTHALVKLNSFYPGWSEIEQILYSYGFSV